MEGGRTQRKEKKKGGYEEWEVKMKMGRSERKGEGRRGGRRNRGRKMGGGEDRDDKGSRREKRRGEGVRGGA